MLYIWTKQEIRQWKHNRFDAYKRNTEDTATRSLPPGRNGIGTAQEKLKEINQDKKSVTTLCGQQCLLIWLEAALLCELTYECPATPGRRLACQKPHDIGLAWKQDAGALNCKRIAFIFDFYGTEVYRRALSTTHQEATSYHIMERLGVVMDVPPEAMLHGQKTCVQQQYSATSNIRKNNILRMGSNKHHVRVNREQGNARKNVNWKRPKQVFFNSHTDPNDHKTKVVDKVSSNYAKAGMCRCWYAG
jgi:hypothetical protein